MNWSDEVLPREAVLSRVVPSGICGLSQVSPSPVLTPVIEVRVCSPRYQFSFRVVPYQLFEPLARVLKKSLLLSGSSP
ncbi:hypothetical protein D3C72_2079590 [compost metagenome]